MATVRLWYWGTIITCARLNPESVTYELLSGDAKLRCVEDAPVT